MADSILIVEDEPIIAEDLSYTLQDFGYKITDIVSNVNDAIESITQSPPRIVMLDINLEGDKDGIYLGGQLQTKHNIPFIYLTSYYDDDTLSRAKNTKPMAYIIKPFEEKDLKVNLEIALHKKNFEIHQSEKLFVKKNSELISILPSDILFVEAIDNYAYLYTTSEKFMISHTLKSIEEKLSDKGFIRIHRSHLVNFEMISSISEGFVYIQDHHLPIGKSYKQNLLDNIVTL